MERPKEPRKPSDLDKLLDKDAERRYHDNYSRYQNDVREYDHRRYGEVNNGPWGDGE